MRAYREWRVRLLRDGGGVVLQSTYMKTLWEDATLTADIVPGAEGTAKQHGIHAVIDGSNSTFLSKFRGLSRELRALGAVELWGTIQEHADGVVRAEHCRILALRLAPSEGEGRCACGRLVIVRDRHSEDTYDKLRRPCVGSACGSAPLRPDLERVGEATFSGVASALRQRYETPALPEGEGPWQSPR